MPPYCVDDADLETLARLAGELAIFVRPGDVLTLRGALGAGKTTFARQLILPLMKDGNEEEIPSPTFSLMQSYDTARMRVFHYDFYRIGEASEVFELGLEDAITEGLVLIEWPEKAENIIPEDHLEISLEEGQTSHTRRVTLKGLGSWSKRLSRFQLINGFLKEAGWKDCQRTYLQGDASARSYTRLSLGDKQAILMDSPKQPDGPPVRNGRPYSAIAHLAEDVRPFVAISDALQKVGLKTPEIYAHDLINGFLLIEDLGDSVFSSEAAKIFELDEIYQAAIDVLLVLQEKEPLRELSLPNGEVYALPSFDREALTMELELLLEWYWRALKDKETTEGEKRGFLSIWTPLIGEVLRGPKGWVLRDYHSPNLIWREGEEGAARVGVIDFQDALIGHPAYDCVSLLQDARLDIPATLEERLFSYYCAEREKQDPHFNRADFTFAYAILGAQRNTKILGIFARLAMRDNKHGYLKHIPRIWRYLERDLAHPKLAELRDWYARAFPKDIRQTSPQIF